jgi:hypothetical protein
MSRHRRATVRARLAAVGLSEERIAEQNGYRTWNAARQFSR